MIAEQTIKVTIDDLDETSAAEPGTYYFQGTTYGIDLGEENRSALKDALAEYDKAMDRMNRFVTVSRPITDERELPADYSTMIRPITAEPDEKPKRRRTKKAAAVTNGVTRATDTEVRQWARDRGMEVNTTGRVAKAVREAYEVAHQE